MKVPLVCRSCGQQQPVDLDSVGEMIVCILCEHESAPGDAQMRSGIQSQHGKTRLWTMIAGGSGFTALALVGLRITWVERAFVDSPLGTALMAGSGLLFVAGVVFLALAENRREVVYF